MSRRKLAEPATLELAVRRAWSEGDYTGLRRIFFTSAYTEPSWKVVSIPLVEYMLTAVMHDRRSVSDHTKAKQIVEALIFIKQRNAGDQSRYDAWLNEVPGWQRLVLEIASDSRRSRLEGD